MANEIPGWTSLEIAKLIVSALIPITVAVVGYVLKRASDRLERTWAESDRLADKKMEIYDRIGQDLNRIFSYITLVGSWKAITIEEITETKRRLDSQVHTDRPFFSEEFFASYDSFINGAFKTYVKPGLDTQVRTTWKGRKEEDKPEYKNRFTGVDNSIRFKRQYETLLDQLALELNLRPRPADGRAGQRV